MDLYELLRERGSFASDTAAERNRLREIIASIHKTASEAELDREPLTACRLIAALTRPEEIENAVTEAKQGRPS